MRIPLPDPDWKLDHRVLRHWLSLEDDPEAEPGMQQAGRRMAAVLLQIAGLDRAAAALAHLRWDEIEVLTFEMARLDVEILSEYEVDVLAEHERLVPDSPPDLGPIGIDYARNVLERAIGVQGAIDIINRLIRSLRLPPFDELRIYSPDVVLHLLERQHPQIVALVLCSLETSKAALLLSGMDSLQKTMIVQRIAELREVARESVELLDRALIRELARAAPETIDSGGPQRAAEIVEDLDEESQREILMHAHPDILLELLERSPEILRAVNDRIQSEDRAAAGGPPQDHQQKIEEDPHTATVTGDAGRSAHDEAAASGGRRSTEALPPKPGCESSGAAELDPLHAEMFSAAMPVFAAKCADDLSFLLGVRFEFRLESLETLEYDRFRRTREEPAAVAVVTADELPGQWLIELSAALGFACVDRLAGGPGLPLRPEREHTRTEIALLDRVLEPVLTRLSHSLEKHRLCRPGLVSTIHPGLLPIGFVAMPGDMVYRVRFATLLGETPGRMTLIVPIKSLAAMSEDPKAAEA